MSGKEEKMRHRATVIGRTGVHVRVRFASYTHGGWRTNGVLTFAPEEWESLRKLLAGAGVEVVEEQCG